MSTTTKEIPLFTLLRFNARRHARGAEAAEVEATWPDGETETLWMSKKDILSNIREFGHQAGLAQALEEYRKLGN
jgi:hypothetical protein